MTRASIGSQADPRDQTALLQRNFSGMNNVTSEDRLTLDEFRNAVNVDMTREGRIQRRAGQRLVHSAQSIRGMWSGDGQNVFFATLNRLKHFTAGEEAITDLYGPVSLANNPTFCLVNGDVYFTDGVRTRIIHPDLTTSPWGVKAPTAAPTLSLASGSLEKGTYLVTATCCTGTGEESGALAVQSIDVPSDGGGINVAGLLAPNDARIVGFRLYLSTPNGEVLYHAADVPRAEMFVTLSTVQAQAAELRTCDLTPMPAGQKLVHYRGRIYVAVGSTLFWSEPLRYGLTNLATNFLVMPDAITLLAPSEEGLFVAAGKTFFLRGRDPESFTLETKLGYGSPDTTYVLLQASHLGLGGEGVAAAWMSSTGFVIGASDGSVANLTEAKVAMSEFDAAAIAYREEDGIRQLLASGIKNTNSRRKFRLADLSVAEVRRNGVVVG